MTRDEQIKLIAKQVKMDWVHGLEVKESDFPALWDLPERDAPAVIEEARSMLDDGWDVHEGKTAIETRSGRLRTVKYWKLKKKEQE